MKARPDQLWLALTLLALVVLPWYGVEDFSTLLKGRPDVMPALWQMGPGSWHMGGRRWLLPLLAAPALGLLAVETGRLRPRLLIAAGVLGVAWIALEGLGITHRGWGWSFLAAFGPAPTQPALGWGALAYAVSSSMLVAAGFARLGRCRGDLFVVSAILLIAGSIVLFIFAPLLSVFASALRNQNGQIDLLLFWAKLSHHSIWELDCVLGTTACGSAWNTVGMATLVGFTSTALGLAFALVAVRTRVRLKSALDMMSILPVITPPSLLGWR